jgi:hypothetical protein
MRHLHTSSAALLLAITATAWAGDIEPYPGAVQVNDASTTTRSQVIAELHEAQRLGLMMGSDGSYPPVAADHAVIAAGEGRVLRARVRAEALEASRLGLLGIGEADAPRSTTEQEALISAAGERAAGQERLTSQVAAALPVDGTNPRTETVR